MWLLKVELQDTDGTGEYWRILLLDVALAVATSGRWSNRAVQDRVPLSCEMRMHAGEHAYKNPSLNLRSVFLPLLCHFITISYDFGSAMFNGTSPTCGIRPVDCQRPASTATCQNDFRHVSRLSTCVLSRCSAQFSGYRGGGRNRDGCQLAASTPKQLPSRKNGLKPRRACLDLNASLEPERLVLQIGGREVCTLAFPLCRSLHGA